MDSNPQETQATQPQQRKDWVHSTAGTVTVWVGLITALITLVTVLLQLPKPAPDSQVGGASLGNANVLETLGNGQPPVDIDDPWAVLGYTTYEFGPGSVYLIDVPGGGGVISVGDSDWPSDQRVALVWHGYNSSPVQDIVVRVTPMPSAMPSEFDQWLNEVSNALRGDLANQPEGDLTSFEINGQVWHNLPLSRYNSAAGYREALDVNMSQFGHDAISVTFYFEIPPGPGIIDKLIPHMLASLRYAPPLPEDVATPPSAQ